ncbi:MAG: hypothetical protein DIU80_008305 [Chloroflexota bacterium]
MTRSTRAWFAAGLAGLVGATAAHTAVLLGAGAWAAMVHLTIFGWITALIVAVSYHTMPVFSGRDFPQPRLAWLQLGLFAAGLGAVTISAAGAGAAAQVAGLGLELAAALVFAANTALLFTRGIPRGGPPPRPPIPNQAQVDRIGTTATKAAGVCLPLSLGLLLAAQAGALGGEWWLAAEHLAALGWVMLMIVGVGYHVLPRFSGRGVRGTGWARAQVTCHLAALPAIVAGLGLGVRPLFAAGGALMALAAALFAYTVWPTLRAAEARPGAIALHPSGRGAMAREGESR